MRKLKFYFDTSVFNYLFADDTPKEMADTIKFWELLKTNEYDIYLSSTTLEELERCNEPKKSKMFTKLKEIEFSLLETTDEVEELANTYISKGVLTDKSISDCMHIAFATLSNCDLLFSWNFNHLVNYKTIKGVRTINFDNNLKEIGIMTPTMFVKGEEENE